MVLSYGFYGASQAISQTPSQTYRDSLQALINSKFDISTSTYELEEEYPIGSKAWSDITVRLNHKINTDTGIRLSDDWRTVIFKDTAHITEVGIKFNIDNEYWLTINTENKRMVTASCLIRRCNWVLKWYSEDGLLIQEPCIVDYVKMIGSAMGVMDGKLVREGTYDRFIYLQANTETLKINRDQRFFVDDLVFRVTKRDTIGHYGLIELSLDEHQINEEIDDVTNKITDYATRPPVDTSNVGITEILEGSSTISKGTNGQWTIYKKNNGTVQSDVYTFSLIGSGANIVSSTNNSVVLKAGITVGSTFTLRATNVGTSAIINKTIQVVEMW